MLAPDLVTEVQLQASSLAKSYPNAQDPLRVLLVEDTVSDEFLMRHAMRTSSVICRLDVIRKGEEVLPHLLMLKQDGLMPDLIILDLGLPGTNGFDVLQDLAAAPAILRGIPIVILTGMHDFEYIKSLYNLPIQAYLAKPCQQAALENIFMQMQKH